MQVKKGSALNAFLIFLSFALLASTVTFAVLYRTAVLTLHSVSESNDALALRVTELNRELSDLNAEIDALEAEKKTAEDEMDAKALKIDGLEAMIELLEDAEEDMEESNTQIASRLAEANRTADTLREEMNALNRKIQLQADKIRALRERSDDLRETVGSLEAELDGARAQIRAWEEAETPLVSPMGADYVSFLTLEADPGDSGIEAPTEGPVEERGIEPTDVQPPPEPDPVPEEPPVFEEQPDPAQGEQNAESPEEPEPAPAEPEPDPDEGQKAEPAPTPPPAPVIEPVPEPLTEPERVLIQYMQKGAPLRWDWISGTDRLTEIYPTLSYYYENLITHEVVTYRADDIRYAASLIKVPYLYTVFREIEAFEAGRMRDENGKILYGPGEEKYNLDEEWVYDPETMYEEGSGEIMEMEAGVKMTIRDLFEYALLYSDNIAFMQIYNRFGYDSFYRAVDELGIRGTPTDFMNLSARDCSIFLKEVYKYFEEGSEYAVWMRSLMSRSKYGNLIADRYPGTLVCHKYGWDVDSYHDMAIVYDTQPYILVVMTDYEDGGAVAAQYYANIVEMTKVLHASGK